MIGGVVVMMFALVGIVINMSGLIETTYLSLMLETPGFDYTIDESGESGNETWDAYVQMRYVALGVMVAAFVYAAIARIFESMDNGMVRPGTSNRILSKGLMFLLLFLIFPVFWDGMSDGIESVSIWVLNPVYSFDPEHPCPAEWYDDPQLALDAYVASPYVTGDKPAQVDPIDREPGRRGSTVEPPPRTLEGSRFEDVCRYDLKVNYIFEQMLRTTQVNDLKNGTGIDGGLDIHSANNWLGDMQAGIQKGSEGIFTNIFLGLTKALIAIQVFIMALIIGIMADMLTAMVIAGMPIFLMLTLIPKGEEIAGKFMDAVPALLLLPLMSSIIIVVGAGAVAETPQTGDGWDHISTWITALGVVFFAITLPVLMVPLLKSATQMATQAVSSAVSSSAMITGMAATGAATGAQGMMRGNFGGHGSQMGMATKAGLLAKAGLMGGAGSMMHGMGNVGMPNMMGSPVVNPQQLGGAMQGEAQSTHTDLSPKRDQEAALDAGMERTEKSGHTRENVISANRQNIGPQWDKHKSDEENIQEYDNFIEKLKKPAAQGLLSHNTRHLVNDWDGPMTHAQNTDQPTMKDFNSAVDQLKGTAHAERPDVNISEGMFEEKVLGSMAKARGIELDAMRTMLESNSAPAGSGTS